MSGPRILIPGLVLCAATFATADEAPKITYADHVFPILESNCLNCHNADEAKGGLDMSSYNSLLQGGSGGEIVAAGDPGGSRVMELIRHEAEPVMPPRGGKLPARDIATVADWIAGGLLETKDSLAIEPEKPAFDLAMGELGGGQPDGPPPMPQDLPLVPLVVAQRPAAPLAMAASPWAPLVAIGAPKQVLLYHAESLELAGILHYPEGFPQSLRFSSNGKLLVCGGGWPAKSGNVVAWDVESGRRVIEAGKEFDAVLAADISADYRFIALGSTAKRVKIFEARTGELVHNIDQHSEWVTEVAFSPDGVLLATADRNGGLYVWETLTGSLFYQLDGHEGAITGLAWRGDSNVLASAGEDGFVRLWEMFKGGEAEKWRAHNPGVLDVAFANDGTVATAGRDREARVSDQKGKQVKRLKGFDDIVVKAAISHDGRRVIAGDWQGNVRVFNVKDGKWLGDLDINPPSLATRLERLAAAETSLLEAAGAARQAKAQAERSLAKTTDELNDAKQGLREADRGVAEAAERVKQLRRKLNGASASAVAQLERELRTASKAIEVAANDYDAIERGLREGENRAALQEQQVLIDAKEDELAAIEARLKEERQARRALETALEEAQNNRRRAEAEVEQLSAKIKTLESRRKEQSERLADAQGAARSAQDALDANQASQQRWRREEINAKRFAARGAMEELVSRRDAYQRALDDARAAGDPERAQQIESELDSLNPAAEQAEKAYAELIRQYAESGDHDHR